MDMFKDIMAIVGGLIGWALLNVLILAAIPIIGLLTLFVGLFKGDWCKEEWYTFIHTIREGNKEIYNAVKHVVKN